MHFGNCFQRVIRKLYFLVFFNVLLKKSLLYEFLLVVRVFALKRVLTDEKDFVLQLRLVEFGLAQMELFQGLDA